MGQMAKHGKTFHLESASPIVQYCSAKLLEAARAALLILRLSTFCMSLRLLWTKPSPMLDAWNSAGNTRHYWSEKNL